MNLGVIDINPVTSGNFTHTGSYMEKLWNCEMLLGYVLFHLNKIDNSPSFLKRIKFKDLRSRGVAFIVQTLDVLGCSTMYSFN